MGVSVLGHAIRQPGFGLTNHGPKARADQWHDVRSYRLRDIGECHISVLGYEGIDAIVEREDGDRIRKLPVDLAKNVGLLKTTNNGYDP